MIGIALYPLAGATHWEERLGLTQLFEWRGNRPPPQDVAVIAIEETTAPALGLPAQLTEWPRSVHARLVERLTEQGAAAVVFDVFFSRPTEPSEDKQFAEAIDRAGRVLLFARSTREVIDNQDGSSIYIDRLEEPLSLLRAAAAGTAPFMLPKWPAQVSRFWTHHEGAGRRETMPTRALRLWHQYHGQRFQFTGTTERIFNFYGPPRTIPMISYQQALQASPLPWDLRGRAVFVGFVSRHQPDQRDGFYTIYSSPDGMDLTGVELAATAFANLLDESYIRPLPLGAWLAVVFLYGVVTMLLARLPWTLLAFAAPLAWAGLYVAAAYHWFVQAYLWLPLIVPVAVLTPLALLWSGLVRNRSLRQQRDRIRAAFGLYLPEAEVKRLAKQPHRGLERERLSGVCLVTDAENYTTLAERLAPEELARLMSVYYEAVFRPIRQHGGLISDVAGDGVIALWTAVALDDGHYARVCQAAWEIQQSVAEFNRLNPETPLPTRIGIHCGAIVLGHMGAVDHYEYRAVGDMVNTTCRVQSLNKELGTWVLISDVCVPRALREAVREVGQFLLSGKHVPVRLFEMSRSESAAALREDFAAALQILQAGQIAAALERFQRLAEQYPDDRVIRFYIGQCELALRGSGNLTETGCVKLSFK